MSPDDQPRRPTGGSRARAGGAARPVDDAATRGPQASRQPRSAGSGASPPAAIPPSFSPEGGSRRPVLGEEAISVGRPTRPTAPSHTSAPSRTPAVQSRPSTPRRAPSAQSAPPTVPRRRGSRRKRIGIVAAVVIVLLVAWPVGLLIWANGKIQHVDALSGAANTPGTTYLLAGSDSRADGVIVDTETLGARTDTIMVLHVPPSGPAALISLPRDTYVDIPGQGPGKLNASFSLGGAPLLVRTVEKLTGLHVDHYVEIGFGGIEHVVDAVGGVELCLDPAVNLVDFPVNDVDSGLQWDAAGCKVVDGTAALAFARMRKSDREGDIGRAKRQQQLISALSSAVAQPSLVVHPGRQVALITTGLGALAVSNDTNILDLGRLALAFRSATGPTGVKGTPPILDADYRPGGVGSTVRLDPDATPGFFRAIMNGTLAPGPVGGMPSP